MNTAFIPLDQFLAARLNESNGVYRSDSPRLGIAGDQRIGHPVPMYFVGRNLAEDEFRAYTEATLYLGRQSAVQQLIDITRLNHKEYKEAIKRLAVAFEQDHSLNWKRVTDMVIIVNQHILNFLSSMKTFLDHTQTRLDREYGKESGQFKRYKEAEHASFDNHFSYRFVSKLRNYTQHCGMPLGHINAGVNQDDPLVGTITHAIDFCFDRDSLLKNFNEWSRHVEPELRSMPSQFPISQHIDTTMECLEMINGIVMAEAEVAMRQNLSVVDGFLNEIDAVQGTACVFTLLSADTKSVAGKTLANLSFQRFHMQHVEETRRILTEISMRREVAVARETA